MFHYTETIIRPGKCCAACETMNKTHCINGPRHGIFFAASSPKHSFDIESLNSVNLRVNILSAHVRDSCLHLATVSTAAVKESLNSTSSETLMQIYTWFYKARDKRRTPDRRELLKLR